VSSNDRRFENDQIYDLPALSPSADHDELLEHQQREDQWRRTREPVATGSKFLKFLTWQDLVDLRLISINDVVGNDDPDLPDGDPDVNNPDSPDFVNEPRIAVYARDMFLPVTYACSPLTVIENDPAKPNLQVLLFDPDTYESAQFVLILPKEWPGRALRYRVYWSHGSGATAYDVSWDMTVHSYEDGESMLNDWATGLRVTDTGGTARRPVHQRRVGSRHRQRQHGQGARPAAVPHHAPGRARNRHAGRGRPAARGGVQHRRGRFHLPAGGGPGCRPVLGLRVAADPGRHRWRHHGAGPQPARRQHDDQQLRDRGKRPSRCSAPT
jgi:hypothetical protein